jgi:hypothetical protein
MSGDFPGIKTERGDFGDQNLMGFYSDSMGY